MMALLRLFVFNGRYKLAAVQSRSVGIQVDVASSNAVAHDTGGNAMGKEIEKLKEEKVVGKCIYNNSSTDSNFEYRH